jgi:hypothetical protein
MSASFTLADAPSRPDAPRPRDDRDPERVEVARPPPAAQPRRCGEEAAEEAALKVEPEEDLVVHPPQGAPASSRGAVDGR